MGNKKTTKKGRNKVASPALPPSKIDSMNFWRELAGNLLPGEDAEIVGEAAVAIYGLCKNLQTEMPTINKICNKNADTKIGIGFNVVIDRRVQPAEVTVKIAYAEKHSNTLKATVPDPNQPDLPNFDEVKVSAEGNGAEGGTDLGEQQ